MKNKCFNVAFMKKSILGKKRNFMEFYEFFKIFKAKNVYLETTFIAERALLMAFCDSRNRSVNGLERMASH